jgi:hypothetical protein
MALQPHKLKISVAAHFFKGFSHCHAAIPNHEGRRFVIMAILKNALRIFEPRLDKVILYLFSSFFTGNLI